MLNIILTFSWNLLYHVINFINIFIKIINIINLLFLYFCYIIYIILFDIDNIYLIFSKRYIEINF